MNTAKINANGVPLMTHKHTNTCRAVNLLSSELKGSNLPPLSYRQQFNVLFF